MHTVRLERDSDAAEIAAVTRAAFGSAEGAGETEAALIEALRSRGKAVVSLVAMNDERVVGHVLFSEVTVETENPVRVLGLAPLGVHPDAQGRGLGSALVDRGLRECRSAGYDAVVVLGEPAYYRRFGFEPAGRYGLSNQYGADEGFMVLGLRPGALDDLTGIAMYEPEFAEVDA